MNEENNINQKERIIEQYKEKIMKYNGAINDKQVKFAEQLTDMVLDKNKSDKVEIIIARCGMGKSVIVNTILDNLVNKVTFGKPLDNDKFTGNGAILITDSLERLDGVNKELDGACYLMKNDLDIPEVENRKNFQQKIKEQFKYPILLITTQRYFSMSKEDREFMYSWAGGKREIAFIDEKPILTNEIVIDEKFLSEIRIALHGCFEGDDKKYLLDTFSKIYDDLDYIRKDYSEKYEVMWFKKSKNTLLINEDEDNKFFNILENNVTNKIYNDVLALKRIYTDGCLFVSKKNKSQDNIRQFIVLNNNTDKFDTDKCKYFILDAAAKFDIDYIINKSIFNYVEIDDKKEISDINIYHIPFNTSQNSLKKNIEETIPMISKWINDDFGDNCLVATYGKKSGLYQKFEKELNTENLAYFGAIKGKNNWKGLHNMIQIGFNRQSDVVYLLNYIYLKNKNIEWNNKKNEDIIKEIESLVELDKGLFKDTFMRTIMMLKLVVDTIQNVMRIKCREFSNTEQCHIYIIANDDKDNFYKNTIIRINDAISSAKVLTFIPTAFDEYKIMNRNTIDGKETNAQKIINWINNIWDGKEIKSKDMLAEIGITRKQFGKVKENNESLKLLLNKYQVKRGIYSK